MTEIYRFWFAASIIYILIEAIKNGLGMGFIPEFIAKDFIKNGTMINPLNISYNGPAKFLLVYPQQNSSQKNILIFSNWLKEELQKIWVVNNFDSPK